MIKVWLTVSFNSEPHKTAVSIARNASINQEEGGAPKPNTLARFCMILTCACDASSTSVLAKLRKADLT